MKTIFSITAAALAVTALPVYPVQVEASQKLGYGQGTAVDSESCPTGAADFNSQYSKYDAYALTNDKNRIILNFDQG